MIANSKVLLRAARGNQQRTLEFIRQITQLESPSHEKQAVDRCGEAIIARFEALGARTRVHRRREVGNILQFDLGPRRSEQPPLMLLGHFDTVWELGAIRRMSLREVKGRLHGPGVFDMKSGIAVMAEALASLMETDGEVPRPVTVLLNTDEETGSTYSRDVIESVARTCGAVLVLEPAQGKAGAVKTSRKGVGDFNIKVTGVAAHAGLDFQNGHNAVLELARQVERVSEFTDLDRGLTVSVGVIQGGTRRNVVPDSAEAQVDVRIARARDAASLERKFRQLRPFDPHCKVEISGGINRMPLERTRGVVQLYRTAQAIAAELGFELPEAAVGGGSDGNLTAALGIPTLDGLGPVGEGAHAAHESIIVSELPKRIALVAELIRRA